MESSSAVADMFRVQVEVGADASMHRVTSICTDFEMVVQSAQDLAGYIAVYEADVYISGQMMRGGPEALIRLARQRGLSSALSDEFPDLGAIEPEYLDFGVIPPRGRRALWLSLLEVWGYGLGAPWARLVGQLHADEVSRRLPDEPFRLRSLTYRNPITLEIIATAGAAATGLAVLMRVIRDWRPRRRRENARADAEERIQRAAAADAEDQAWARARLRRLLLERVAGGELPISPDAIDGVVSDALARSAERLFERQLSTEQTHVAEE